MKPKVYIETTIISYLTARPSRDLVVAAHQQLTTEWWTTRLPDFEIFGSEFVFNEAAAGDQAMARKRLEILADIPILATNQASLDLAKLLIEGNIVPRQFAEDASHVSIATVHGMDYLLTWNCKHIANAQLQRRLVSVCQRAGYEPPVICTPEELMGG